MSVRRRPSRAAAAVVACGATLIVLSGPAQAMWLAVAGALVLGVPVASALSRHGLDGAVVELSAPAVLTAGDLVPVEVVVRPTARRLPVHRLELIGPPFGDVAVLVDSVRPGAAAMVSANVVAARRGSYSRQSATARTGAPFGLLVTRRTWDVPCQVDVGAQVVDVSPHVVRALTGAADSAAEVRRGPGDGVHAVRDFRSGDALRDVHWRSTARAGRLVVREYERPVPTLTAVVVAGGVPGLAFEALMVAATSIAHATWRAGEPVDVVRCTADSVVTTRSASRHGIHAWSAAADPVPAAMPALVESVVAAGPPAAAVLAVGPGVVDLAAGCVELARTGCRICVVALPGTDLSGLAAGITVRVLRPGVGLADALAGAAA